MHLFPTLSRRSSPDLRKTYVTATLHILMDEKKWNHTDPTNLTKSVIFAS